MFTPTRTYQLLTEVGLAWATVVASLPAAAIIHWSASLEDVHAATPPVFRGLR
jgi:protein gp37